MPDVAARSPLWRSCHRFIRNSSQSIVFLPFWRFVLSQNLFSSKFVWMCLMFNLIYVEIFIHACVIFDVFSDKRQAGMTETGIMQGAPGQLHLRGASSWIATLSHASEFYVPGSPQAEGMGQLSHIKFVHPAALLFCVMWFWVGCAFGASTSSFQLVPFQVTFSFSTLSLARLRKVLPWTESVVSLRLILFLVTVRAVFAHVSGPLLHSLETHYQKYFSVGNGCQISELNLM